MRAQLMRVRYSESFSPQTVYPPAAATTVNVSYPRDMRVQL